MFRPLLRRSLLIWLTLAAAAIWVAQTCGASRRAPVQLRQRPTVPCQPNVFRLLPDRLAAMARNHRRAASGTAAAAGHAVAAARIAKARQGVRE